MMTEPISDNIADFLDFLELVGQLQKRNTEDLNKLNTDIKDLEHFIEFDCPDARGMVQTYKLLRDARRDRRKAKERLELYAPIVEWHEINKKMIRGLQEVLGRVRKIENIQENRVYSVRGDVLKGLTDKTHLAFGKDNKKEIG